ncbi:MAG TPA: CFI-box-CTERM domain-containing protein [Puia sp.]|jgi:hypothetical protein|nr:CFI-box-CTERM domain-containing protein [Puia sp.]
MKLNDLLSYFELYRNLKESGKDTVLNKDLLEKEKEFVNRQITVPGVVSEIDFLKKEIIITYKDKTVEHNPLKRFISNHFFVFATCEDLDGLIKQFNIETDDLVQLTGVVISLHRKSAMRIAFSSISVIEKNYGLTKSSDKKGCFIASAVYGSRDAEQVQQFYQIRDLVIAKSWLGRIFIRFYYGVSPTLAKWIDKRPAMKSFIKKYILDKILRRFQDFT